MNRRAFLAGVPAVALAASPAASTPLQIPARERLKNAIDDIDAVFRELYPDLKVTRHISEIRAIDEYDPSHVQLIILAA